MHGVFIDFELGIVGLTAGCLDCQKYTLEHWLSCQWLKPEDLGSAPGGTTFLSSPLLFQSSLDSDGSDI